MLSKIMAHPDHPTSVIYYIQTVGFASINEFIGILSIYTIYRTFTDWNESKGQPLNLTEPTYILHRQVWVGFEIWPDLPLRSPGLVLHLLEVKYTSESNPSFECAIERIKNYCGDKSRFNIVFHNKG